MRVVDGDTFDLDGTRYRLNGIDAPEAGQTCKTASGRNWACGTAATDALYDLTSHRAVECDALARDDYDRIIANCHVDGQDLGAALVSRGMAWAFVKFSDVYETRQQVARAKGIGIWQGAAQAPWDYRAEKWSVAAQTAPQGCPIKGNISPNGQIYHPPWSPWYSRTKISVEKGERWFCTEAEALRAGWRAPYWK